MRRGTIALLVAAGMTLLGTLPAAAQSTTGRIRGEVRDPQGTPLTGVLVTLSGDELQGGARSATTGDSGAYSFPGLAPGSYSLTASLEGYRDATSESVQVNLGATTTRDFRMLAEFGEELTVAGAMDLVDVTASGVSTTYSAEFIEDLPTTRNFYDLMSVSPGVSLAAEDTDRLVAMGSNVQSNAWYIDGIETTAPETGTAWVGVNPDMIEEIQVQGIGAPAEFGNMMGAALNVVTKSGTNDFEGGANVYWFDDSLVDSSIGFDGSEFSEFSQKEFWDATGTLGGPLSKDRLFFFGAYEYWRDGHAFPGADPDTTPTWYKDRYDLKLSARVNDKNLIQAKGYFEDWGFPEPGSQFVADSARAGEVGTTTAWGLDLQSIWTDRTFFEARYSGWKSDDDNLSQTGSTEPAFIDYSPPGGGPAVFTGGVYYPWTYDTASDQLSAAVSHFADDFLHGDHDFKFGIQLSQGNAETLVATSATGSYYYHYAYTYEYYGNNYVYDYFYRVDGLPYFYGNDQESWAAFVDDSWKVTDRLTLNLGVRFDHQQGSFPSFPRLDATGSPSGFDIAGADVFEWNNVSPRLGFAYNAGKDRRTVIRGSFGVYYDGNVGGNWNYPPLEHPGLQAYVSFDGFGGPYEEAWSFHPGESIIDPDLEAPRTLQYALGFETQIGDAYSVGVQGIYKDTTDLVGWEILGDGVYAPLNYTDPFSGDSYVLLDPVVFPSLRKGNSPGFTVDPDADEYWQEYWAVILTFDRRMTDWWSMQASYTYSESTGLIPRFLSQWQFNPFYSSREGADPNSFLNANGQKLQGDRPHMLRVQANFELPRGLRANTSINLQDGRPYSRQGRLPTEGRPVAILERGFRHGFQNLVDVGLGKTFKLKNGFELNLDVQVLNVLNDVETDWFETVVLEPGDEFIPASNGGWIKPRRFQLRAGFRF